VDGDIPGRIEVTVISHFLFTTWVHYMKTLDVTVGLESTAEARLALAANRAIHMVPLQT
jgi:hypothetical protein